MKELSCKECGSKFVPNSNSQKYCSISCQKVKRRVKTKILQCEFCKKEYENVSSKQKYCSEKCRAKAKAKRIAKPKIINLCKTCGTRFEAAGKSRNAVYCCVSCRRARWKERLVKKECAYCRNQFIADKRTECCSTECSSKHFDTKIELDCIICGKSFKTYKSRVLRDAPQQCCSMKCYRASRRTGKSINCYCNNCNKGFYKAPSLQKQHAHNFCSVHCMGDYYSNSGMFAGENSGTYIGSFDRRKKYYGENWHPQRRAARKRDNYTCQRCGITEQMYGQELSVHHKVPFVLFNDYRDANRLDNLLSVCEPCHRQIHSGDNHPTKYGQKPIR